MNDGGDDGDDDDDDDDNDDDDDDDEMMFWINHSISHTVCQAITHSVNQLIS